MKRFLLSAMLCVLFFISLSIQSQSIPVLTCGDTLADRFVDNDLSHTYAVDIDSGTILVIQADPLPLDSSLDLSLELLNNNGSLILNNPFAPSDRAGVIETPELLSSESYELIVESDQAGDYQLFISCVDESGDVISDNNLVQSLSCGEQVDNTMIRSDEFQRYYIFLKADTVIDVFLDALYGDFAEMTFEIGLYSPTNQEIDGISEMFKDTQRAISNQAITVGGLYRLYVRGFDSTDENYRLSLDCTLPDGNIAISDAGSRRVLEPTLLSESSTDTEDETTPTNLIEGVPNTGQFTPENNNIAYHFTGNFDETITLHYMRVRGEGIVNLALEAPDGEILFDSTLSISDTLSTQMALPQTGDYLLSLTSDPDDDIVFAIEVNREE